MFNFLQNAGATSKTVNEVELYSLVSHVQDLLPGLGDGFVILCLEEFNYDVEQVINLLLEDNLPPSLQSINRNLSKEEVMKSRKQPAKTTLEERHSVFDKDEFDVFSGNKVDVSKVHKGKRRNVRNLKTLLSDKSDFTEPVKQRYSAYDVFDRHAWTASLYDDEYDDTYDSQNVGAQDADSVDELTVRRWVKRERLSCVIFCLSSLYYHTFFVGGINRGLEGTATRKTRPKGSFQTTYSRCCTIM